VHQQGSATQSSLEKLGQDPNDLKGIEDRLGVLDKTSTSVMRKALDLGSYTALQKSIQKSLKHVYREHSPFEESHEKGFELPDMFSILEANKRPSRLNAFVVSEDKLFTKRDAGETDEREHCINSQLYVTSRMTQSR